MAARLLTDEVKRHAARPHQILRSQSLASRVLAVHSRAVGGDFLRATLGAHVRGVLAEVGADGALEVDPARLSSGPTESNAAAVDANVASLRRWADAIVGALDADALPPSMRSLCRAFVAAGAACDVHAPVGGYLVLRFLVPALASPEAFGVVDAPPPAGARRSLVLLSKLVQAASNGALPGAREPHMQPFDAWARDATPRIAAFLDAAGAPAADGAPTDDAATISRPPTDAAEAGCTARSTATPRS